VVFERIGNANRAVVLVNSFRRLLIKTDENLDYQHSTGGLS
jgi:hypothetical protein